jgi:hypothetical protein
VVSSSADKGSSRVKEILEVIGDNRFSWQKLQGVTNRNLLYRVLQSVKILFSCEDVPENGFASFVNRPRPRKAIKPYLVLDGGIDCEKTGGPTKQVERRGAPNPVPLIPMRTSRIDQKDHFDAEAIAVLGSQRETIGPSIGPWQAAIVAFTETLDGCRLNKKGKKML